MRVSGGNANPERTDLRVRGFVELYGAANGQSVRLPIGAQGDSIVPIGGQGDYVSSHQRARVVTNHHPNIHRLRRYHVQCHASGEHAVAIVESHYITIGIAVLQRYHGLLWANTYGCG